MGKINIKQIKDIKLIKNLIKNSDQNSIFTNPEFLNLFQFKFEWWVAEKGNEKVCLWPVCINNEKKMIIPDFFYYLGPIWIIKKFKDNIEYRLTLDVYNEFIKNFLKIYKNIHSQLHFTLSDIRAFDWYNYNSKPRFLIYNKYTALKFNLKRENEKKIVENYRYVRRNELGKFSKIPKITTTNQIEINFVIELYEKVVGEQNINANTNKILYTFDKLIKLGKGSYIVVKVEDKIASVGMILNEKKTSNLVLNLNENNFKNKGSNSYLINEVFKYCINNKIYTLDFNGANSPNRADDKHSYGTTSKNFYEIFLSN